MIVNYASSIVNKLEALLTGDARVIIYDHHVFIVQATELNESKLGKVFNSRTGRTHAVCERFLFNKTV
jgi:hypothetical protein